ncbi:MAG TPA: tetratricopeptide repeat protein, partial [Dongiaceae bacterium]|nr:tetratricopeptide repeat protein [Dongiaceae bacterium]
MSNESDSFIQEVDDQVRADRMVAGLRKYGPWLAGLLVIAVLSAIGWEAWRNMQTSAARQQSDLLAAAQKQLHDGDASAAATAFATLSNTGPENYRVMAMMEHAAALEEQGDLQAALAGFDAAASAAKDDLLRDTARLRAAYLVADTQ